MIHPGLIVASAVVTAIWVTLIARWSHWSLHQSTVAGVISALAIVAWRLGSNVLHLNDDFMPAVSVGDVGCLVAGALGPAFVRLRHIVSRATLVVIISALGAFVANVVIL